MSRPSVALLLAGGEVWEDFLDTIGVSLERFCQDGPGGWVLGYIDALDRAGIRTVVILFSARISSPMRFGQAPGTTIAVLPAPRAYRALRQLTHGRRGRMRRRLRTLVAHTSTPVRLLARELRREACRAIVCQEYEHFRFATCIGLGRLLRVPVYATFQGGRSDPNAISRAIRPLTIPAAAGLFIAAGSEISRVRACYGVPAEKIAQIFNPVDIALWGSADRAHARAKLGIPAEARVAVWHGRTAIVTKGLDVLLDAWIRLSSERPRRDLRLLLLGTGQDADQLRRRIEVMPEAGVVWRNEYLTDRRAIRQWLCAGDVYAFPSRHEGFAVAPIEAMACGLPVVAAAASGVPDIFHHGEASGGIVVPPGDVPAFADALGRVLDDPALACELGRRARRRVEEALSLEAVGRELRAVFRRSNVLTVADAEAGTRACLG